MANRRGDTLGQEGRYRRTASPQTAKKSAALLSQVTLMDFEHLEWIDGFHEKELNHFYVKFIQRI